MPDQPICVERSAVFADNISLWQSQPLLEPSGQSYMGRVFVEVWDGEDTHLVATNDALRGIAYEALSDQRQSISATNSPLTNKPATGAISGQSFIGRVIVEIWTDRIVIGTSGAASTVRERALQAFHA